MVSKARHDLILLVRLQRIYDSITEALAERNTPPAEIRDLQEANRLRLEELEALEQQIALHEEEVGEVRKKQAEWELELEHFQKQKSSVTNEREFTAVISEIDYANKAIEETTARREELEGAIEQIGTEVAERREARPEEEETQSVVITEWENRKSELSQSVHELSSAAKELETDIQPKHRSLFMRLLGSKQGTAISEVIDGSCSLCHFALRPHLQQRVRRAEEIIDCEHCHRILFVEGILVSDEVETADG